MHSLQVEGRAETSGLSNSRRLTLFGIALALVVLDQVTKALATSYLAEGRIIRLFDGDLVWLLYVQNPGLAFGMTFLPPTVLMIISAGAAVMLGWYLYHHANISLSQSIPLALILAGALGNMIDRIFIGQVTDFVSVDFPDFIMDRFPVFNVADACVSIGVTLMVLTSFQSPPANEDEQDQDQEPEPEETNQQIR